MQNILRINITVEYYLICIIFVPNNSVRYRNLDNFSVFDNLPVHIDKDLIKSKRLCNYAYFLNFTKYFHFHFFNIDLELS